RLRQCLFNLVGNALKFTETGGVVVRLRSAGEPHRPMFRIEVEDTGIGVPEAARPRLFGLFTQAEPGTAQKFGGTGLGLAISRQLARLMGGDVGYSSRSEGGSLFWFDFEAPPTAAAPAAVTDAFSEAPLAGLSILIVDDNPTNQLIARVTIEAMGGQASTVSDGLAAIEALGREAYDLVLMDVNMPGLDGLETTRRLRALPNTTSLVPIVALTADGSMRQRQACLAAGMNDVAAKPVLPAQLLAAILPLVGHNAGAARAEPDRQKV
ncbi:MAG: response regulator, partial [Caulobacteraceae bacterium]